MKTSIKELREHLRSIMEADEEKKEKTVDTMNHDSLDAELDQKILGLDKAAKAAAEEHAKVTKSQAEPLDLNELADNAARLVQNIDKVLDLEGVALRRLFNYISQTYGENTVNTLQTKLADDYHVFVTEPPPAVEDLEYDLATPNGGASAPDKNAPTA